MVYVMFICLSLDILFFYALIRAEVDMDNIKARYLEGIALDLAENGVEKAAYNLHKQDTETLRETVDKFAGNDGLFITETISTAPAAYKIISTGKVISPEGETICEDRVITHLEKTPEGSWKIVKWRQN